MTAFMIAAGVISGLVAAVFGFIDWLGIPARTRAKSVGLWHACGNVVVLVLFAISWWFRRGDPTDPPMVAFILALIGTTLTINGYTLLFHLPWLHDPH